MTFFKDSSDMFDQAGRALGLSLRALDAEFSIDAYNQGMHLKMASTIVIHGVRCIMNMGYFIFDFFNMVYNIGKERDIGAVFGGLVAMTVHLVAALIDFVNVFVTSFATLTRSVVSLVNGYKPSEENLSTQHSEPVRLGSLIRHTVSLFSDKNMPEESYENDLQRYYVAGSLAV